MSGDNIRTLPVNDQRPSKPGDLELIYNLFQPKSIGVMKQAVGPFTGAIVGSILFGVLSLPFVLNVMDGLCKNPIYSRLILMVVFILVFFLVTRKL